MKELGGFIELDTYNLPMMHNDAISLNCGRNALAYLIKSRKITRLLIPKLICDSIPNVCNREGIKYSFYNVGNNFLPSNDLELANDEWLYFVNYYSQFDNDTIANYVKKYKRVIVDQTHSFFQLPLDGVDTIYTCRKYFGVPDGAFLYTDERLDDTFLRDESYNRMHHLLGRYERTASEFYEEYVRNDDIFAKEPIKYMSKLTTNLLHAIDYEKVKRIRQENYVYLNDRLKEFNLLRLSNQVGTFMYPLLLKNGYLVRKKFQAKKIYIPLLWPSVFDWTNEEEKEYELANNILPLPIDQRYGLEDMEYIVDNVMQNIM